MACSLKENLTLHWQAMERFFFSEQAIQKTPQTAGKGKWPLQFCNGRRDNVKTQRNGIVKMKVKTICLQLIQNQQQTS